MKGVVKMYYTDDPLADFARWDADQERKQSELPVCDECGERIQDEYCYTWGGCIICEDCMEQNHKREVERLAG